MCLLRAAAPSSCVAHSAPARGSPSRRAAGSAPGSLQSRCHPAAALEQTTALEASESGRERERSRRHTRSTRVGRMQLCSNAAMQRCGSAALTRASVLASKSVTLDKAVARCLARARLRRHPAPQHAACRGVAQRAARIRVLHLRRCLLQVSSSNVYAKCTPARLAATSAACQQQQQGMHVLSAVRHDCSKLSSLNARASCTCVGNQSIKQSINQSINLPAKQPRTRRPAALYERVRCGA